ncbi:uncharacterized protein [Trachinotus anak]|uniref:uncharacterized protein isoform X5 n=1 Tax=Trachinotus anak TaxID=443729 RepID=UPI0039F219DD
MGGWTLVFVLLLPLTVCFDSKVPGSEVTLEKTLGSKPDVTPICTNDTQNIISLIVCKINTQRSSGEECGLLYRHGQDFENKCDSKFTLTTENQTMFLHLTSLTPEDSGNYTCECSRTDGTDILHLSVTVEDALEDEGHNSSTEILILTSASAAAAVVIMTGVILGVIHRRKRVRSWSTTSGLSVNETPHSADQEDPDDPYTSLQQPESDFYQTIHSVQRQRDTSTTSSANNVLTVHLDDQGGEGDSDSSCEIYENVSTGSQVNKNVNSVDD